MIGSNFQLISKLNRSSDFRHTEIVKKGAKIELVRGVIFEKPAFKGE